MFELIIYFLWVTLTNDSFLKQLHKNFNMTVILNILYIDLFKFAIQNIIPV